MAVVTSDNNRGVLRFAFLIFCLISIFRRLVWGRPSMIVGNLMIHVSIIMELIEHIMQRTGINYQVRLYLLFMLPFFQITCYIVICGECDRIGKVVDMFISNNNLDWVNLFILNVDCLSF